MRILLSSLLILTGAAAGQSVDFGDLRQGSGTGAPAAEAARPATGGLSEGGRPLAVQRVYGQQIGFQPGRDNLGFPNLSGAVRLGGMAGNCYTMAYVAKLFFEDARFQPSEKPEAERAGFTLAELSAHLQGSHASKMQVKDFASLHEMSYDPGFGEDEAFAHLARERGIRMDKAKAGALMGKRKMIAQLVQLISTIHYLHYMQYQAGSFVEAVLRQKMAGSKEVQALTKREVAAMASGLEKGKTRLLLMLNVREVYGHVVLAYRIARTAEADYIYVYDSNVQYAQETRPSVLKVARDGKVAGYYRLEADGELSPHAIYDGDSWFSARDTLAVIDLPDLRLDKENMQALAKKTLAADAETAYLLAGGHLLQRLTERSPEESSLRSDVTQFLQNVQSIQTSLGQRHFDESERLGPDASVRQVNAFLARHADYGIRTAFPYALPKGVSLTGTRVQLDEKDPNKALLATTLTLEKDGPVHRLAGVLQRSAAMADYPELASWIEATRENVGPTKVRAEIELYLTKQRLPPGLRTTYGVWPAVRSSHVVVGDIEPSKKLGSAFQIEISEAAMRGGLETALSRLGILGKKYEFEYVLVDAKYTPGWIGEQKQLTPEIRRKGYARLRDVELDLVETFGGALPGKLRLSITADSFVAINPVMADRGVSGEAKPVNLDLVAYRNEKKPAGQWHVLGVVDGDLKFDDGVWNLLPRAVTFGARHLFPYVRDCVNGYIRKELDRYVKLLEPFQVNNLNVSTKRLHLDTGAALLDVDELASRIFNVRSPVVLTRFVVKDDRLIVGTDPR